MADDIECERLRQRRDAILASARALFVEQGYQRTTLGQVVLRAGGSLATIYKLFGNKEGLFEAVIEDKMLPATAIMRELAETDDCPERVLRRIGEALYQRFLSPEDIALTRLVIARSVEDPGFAKRFFETKAFLTREALTRIFAQWQAQGVHLSGDPLLLAEIFVGLIVNDFQQEAISHGTARHVTKADIDHRIDFFLRGAALSNAFA